jgi:hypothetical protein
MNAWAFEKLPLREISAVPTGTFEKQDVVVLHVLHPKPV